jgi:uncharacterized protein (DUF305 family)
MKRGIVAIVALAGSLGLYAVAADCAATITPANTAAQQKKMHGMMQQMNQMKTRMVQMLGGSDAYYDLRFIEMMIPHHEGAIAMAQDALKDSQHPEVKEMAQKIIDSQQKEIEQLKAWRKHWYGI